MSDDNEPRTDRISDAEHAVMEALWEKSPLAAAEVCDEVCDKRGWSIACSAAAPRRSSPILRRPRRSLTTTSPKSNGFCGS
jgi:hypothetical protein